MKTRSQKRNEAIARATQRYSRMQACGVHAEKWLRRFPDLDSYLNLFRPKGEQV